MVLQEEVIRAAVRAALANDTALESCTGAIATASSVPSPTPAPAQKRKPQSKKSRSSAPDSNWKKLQKSLAKPGGRPRPKRPRRPSAVPPRAPTPEAAPDAKFSAFMKRRVTDTDEISRVVALDCEMVGVGPGGVENALARVSVVNYSGDVLYDSLVRVHEPVTDYRTAYSGIRPGDVSPDSPEAVELAIAQRVVGELLRGRVLVGHAIRNDLSALRLKHPWRDVRDTSEFYRRLWRKTKGRRSARPPALRMVVASVLGVDAFQKEEHDSCEDARAALMLYKRNAKAWEAELRAKGMQRKQVVKRSSKAEKGKEDEGE